MVSFVIWFICNLICQISAETSSTLLSKDSLSAKTITNNVQINSDSRDILPERYKRDVNADKIFVEINRIYDKIDQLGNLLEQAEENRKKEILILKEDATNARNKVGSIEEKLIVTQQWASHQFTELVSKIEQDKLNADEKFSGLEELVSKNNECLNTSKKNEVEIKRRGGFESNTNRIEQSFLNLTKFFSSDVNKSAFISTNNISRTVNQSEKESPMIDEGTWSNRIRDGPSQCRLWPDGKVPFEIDSTFGSNIRGFIDEAINDFHNKTCIRWVPRQSEGAFVYFSKLNNSLINKTEECYTGGRRIAIVGEEFNRKDVLRQMAYILGLGEEHLRQDRDEYTELRWNNCTLEEKYPHLNGGGFYDYQSVTHPNCGRRDCVQLKRSQYRYIYCGDLGSLSVLDSNKLNEMYNCNGCHSLRFQFPNQIGFNESTLVPVFENAHENRKHICRVSKYGMLRVGRGNAKTGECHYMYVRPTMASQNVQFLTNPQQTKIQWVSRGREFPQNAVPGGYSNKGSPFYIARCAEEPQWGESVVPENIHNNERSMYMLDTDSYNACSSFDILTCP